MQIATSASGSAPGRRGPPRWGGPRGRGCPGRPSSRRSSARSARSCPAPRRGPCRPPRGLLHEIDGAGEVVPPRARRPRAGSRPPRRSARARRRRARPVPPGVLVAVSVIAEGYTAAGATVRARDGPGRTALTTDYRVQLDTFEGPLDLLLYLIRKAEVEIADIPSPRSPTSTSTTSSTSTGSTSTSRASSW
jgi:hypothetical protein